MTLSARNSIFKAGIITSLFSVAICIIASIHIIPIYDTLDLEISRRSEGIFQALLGNVLQIQLLAVNGCIAASAVYAALSIILVYIFFEKTLSPEILFVVMFAASFAPETLRLVIPLGQIYEIPALYALMASRIILFTRFFGIFSLFIAGVFAAGYDAQRQRSALLFVIVAAMIIAFGVPVDTQSWDSSLRMISGYTQMFQLIEMCTFFITVISFFIAAWSRGGREFIFVGCGAALALLGRNILLTADSWAGLPAALALLVPGTWLICIFLHKIYLWL